VAHRAERIDAAAAVLDDLQYSQLFYERADQTKREVLRGALIQSIAADAKRLRQEPRKATPSLTAVA
jgi:hypothetical protein